jgi:hypothetical protein
MLGEIRKNVEKLSGAEGAQYREKSRLWLKHELRD